MAHRHGGRDAGASRPGRHALVDQPGQIGQPPAGADHIPAFPVRCRVAEAGGSRLRPGIRRRALAQGAERTPTAVHHALAHPLPAGRRKGRAFAWQITRGKRSQDHRQIWDLHRRQYRKTGIVAVPVRHPQGEDQLWLVVSRPGKGRWYLLTNEPIATPDDAWRVVMAYARRGRWRCATGPARRTWPWRVHGSWENRLKLLLMVSLVYAFLLSLLDQSLGPLVRELLRYWCHRTGERYRQAAIPLSRLRAALSALWLTHPPQFTTASQTSG